MYTNETKDQFLALRATGLSLARIASQLGVSKRTLVDWNAELQPQVRALRAVELEALHEKILLSHEKDLRRLARFQKKIQQELANRPLLGITTFNLFHLDALLRRQIRELRAEPDLLLKAQPAPQSPLSETTAEPAPQPPANS